MISGIPKTYNLPTVTIEAVEKIAKTEDRSASSVVRSAISLLIIAKSGS
jgi:hypothetical protein